MRLFPSWDITYVLHCEVYHSTPQLEAEESQLCKSADSPFFLYLPELLANVESFVEPHGLPKGQAYWNTSAKGGCISPSNHTQKKRKAFPLLDRMSEEKAFIFLHSCNSQGIAKQECKLKNNKKFFRWIVAGRSRFQTTTIARLSTVCGGMVFVFCHCQFLFLNWVPPLFFFMMTSLHTLLLSAFPLLC